MPETFQSFHSQGAQEAESILGLPFVWGTATFSAVIAQATVEDDDVDEPGDPNAMILKARAAQFSGSYPQINATITGGGKRFRVVDNVYRFLNDPFISIPVVELPAT